MRFLCGLAVIRTSTIPAGRDADQARGNGLALLGLAPGLALALIAALTFGAGTAQAAFPGSNGRIACSGPLGPNPPPAGGSFLEIFTMDDSGAKDANGNPTSQIRLQNNTNSDFNPRYSADGTQIAFIKDNNVWKMSADGSNEVQLTNQTIDSFVGGWSPDGSKIVFQRSNPAEGTNPANFEVFTINADGTGLTNVSNNPGSATVGNSDSQPSFSPDGSRIAFQSNRLGNPDIWVMNANGTGARPLTADSLAEESAPEFSPDGQQIAFQSDRGMIPRTTGRNLEIYRMSSLDGSNVVRLTFNDYNPAGAGGETTNNLSGFDLNPHWSPQGDKIVFHSGRGIEFGAAQWDAFVINSATGENPIGGTPAVRLTARDFNDERCGWGVATPHILLSLAKTGSGEGTVTSDLAGIDCGADCAQGYAPGTMVTLTATPAAGGSTFAGFTGGGCAGVSTTCTVTVDQAKTITAAFTDPNPALTVIKTGSGARKAGTGTGTVTSAPTGISCGADCTEEYASGTSVTLTATPAAGSTFDGFTGGGCSGTANTCTVTMSQARTVTAIFSGPLLTVTKAGTGTGGTVTSSPFGISCGVDCTEDYTAGTLVTLTATANTSNVAGATGSTFSGFSGGGCTGTATTCVVTMDAAKTVTATFVDFPTLTVSKTGTGTGTVTSATGGLNCGATCTRDFPIDSTVTLTAAPAAGSVFAGFTGGGCTGTATTCVVTMDAAKTVTASFVLPRLTVTRAGAGTGTVTSAPAGINCGGATPDCTEDYAPATSVTLTAAPTAASSNFTGWSGGGCTGSATTCTVTMDQVRAVTATFGLLPRALTVTKAGGGSGTVTTNPAGVDCGADCTENFNHGTVVTLAANPAAGSNFTGFTGAGCSGSGTTCTVAMTEARSVTATFGIAPAIATTPPPPPPPPPPAPAAVTTPPPPPAPAAATPTRRNGSLSATVTPGRDLTAPFVFRTSGRLTLPSGMTRAEGCNGRVSIQIKRGGTTISTRRVSLRSNCTYSSRVSFTSRGRFGRSTQLKFTARFLGNALVRPDAASSRFARVRLARIAR